MSTSSGIPDFRSPGGLWDKYDPMELDYNLFLEDPSHYWKVERKLFSYINQHH